MQFSRIIFLWEVGHRLISNTPWPIDFYLLCVSLRTYRYLLIKMISIDINAKGIYLIVKFVRRQLRQLRRKQQNVRDFCANSCPKIQIYCQTQICSKIIFWSHKETDSVVQQTLAHRGRRSSILFQNYYLHYWQSPRDSKGRNHTIQFFKFLVQSHGFRAATGQKPPKKKSEITKKAKIFEVFSL